MAKRYTKSQFESDIEGLNAKMRKHGIDRIYIPGYRYGYAAVDWATKENADRHCVNGTVCTGGTKKEMIQRASQDALAHL